MDDSTLPFLEEKPADYYMNLAIAQARKALEFEEVPVGAVIVDDRPAA